MVHSPEQNKALKAAHARIESLEDEVADLEHKLSEAENEVERLDNRGRTAAEMLVDAVRAELGKFTFPEEDRPELYDALCKYEDEVK
jgi:predicted  nucleic acid-binding Zn-ribbon protein